MKIAHIIPAVGWWAQWKFDKAVYRRRVVGWAVVHDDEFDDDVVVGLIGLDSGPEPAPEDAIFSHEDDCS